MQRFHAKKATIKNSSNKYTPATCNASYDKALLAKILVRKLEHELKFILEERRFRHWAGYFCRLACLVTRYGK